MGAAARPRAGCVHAAGARVVTNTVPLGGFVAEWVLETATLGSACKVFPNTRQLSVTQQRVKGL